MHDERTAIIDAYAAKVQPNMHGEAPERLAFLGWVRSQLRERGLSGAAVARQVGKSASMVNEVLRGNYPYYGGGGMPLWFYNWLAGAGLNPDGRLHSFVLEMNGERREDRTWQGTEPEAERRNASFAKDGKPCRWVLE